MRIIISGSPEIQHESVLIKMELEEFLVDQEVPITEMVCPTNGVGKLATLWAKSEGFPLLQFRQVPLSLKNKKTSELFRNKQMVGSADALILFMYPGDKVSFNLLKKARSSNLVIRLYMWDKGRFSKVYSYDEDEILKRHQYD